ncbi:putative ribonuclease H-like domain-containing protein [Tanacetum coccineum]
MLGITLEYLRIEGVITIEEEVYVCQPLGFDDPDILTKFTRGKIDHTLFIKKQKGDILLVQVYVDDIIFGSINKELCTEFEKLMHDKFQMSSMGELNFFLDVRTTSIPMVIEKPLLKDSDGDDVDVYLYRSMIGSLMYLTSSRPDIMYLKCQPKLGSLNGGFGILEITLLSGWHILIVDYAGAKLDRKSTIGGCQFLGCRLISWQCKKQTMVSTSSTEAEYMAAASCCEQVLWIQNQMLDYGYNFMHTMINIDNNREVNNVNMQSRMNRRTCNIKQRCVMCQTPRQIKRGRDTKIPQSSGPLEKVGDEAIHKELGDRMEKAVTTASSLEAEQDNGNNNRTKSMATLNEASP